MAQGADLTIGTGEGSDSDDVAVSCDSVASKVVGIVAEVLHRPRSEIGVDTKARDVEGWDSFAHVRIVMATDAAFGIKLSMNAIEGIDGVAALVEAVEAESSSL